MSLNVVIACGGTGGHLFPGLAVAEVLRERGHQVLIFISEKEIDALAVRDHAGQFRFEKLPSIGLPRRFSFAIFGFMIGLVRSAGACLRIYRGFRPQAVLGMGGFTSTAPILAGRLAGVPTFVHESNAIPGKANRINARLAQTVLLGFQECASSFPARSEVTGTPIRASLRAPVNRATALASFGFSPGSATDTATKTLLVMGGSQGARGINRAVLAALPAWKFQPMRIIHFTGRDEENEARAAYVASGLEFHAAAFCHTMENAYAAADLVIARSGAASLSELAYFGLPSVLIPYPFAAEDHQTLNARIFAGPGAAILIPEPEAADGRLAQIITDLLQNPARLAEMAAAARRLAPADAARLVVDVIERNASPAAAAKPSPARS